MKDTHFLYGVAILAVIGIITVFIVYATDTLPKPVPTPVTAKAPKVTKQKKECSCCSEKLNEVLKKIKKDIRTNRNIDEIWIELVEDF